MPETRNNDFEIWLKANSPLLWKMHQRAFCHSLWFWPTLGFAMFVQDATLLFCKMNDQNAPLSVLQSIFSIETIVAITALFGTSMAGVLILKAIALSISGKSRRFVERTIAVVALRKDELFYPFLVLFVTAIVFILPFEFAKGTASGTAVKLFLIWLVACCNYLGYGYIAERVFQLRSRLALGVIAIGVLVVVWILYLMAWNW